ncbi:MAG TPA: glutamate--tRNA ligase [Candidatus Ruthenibacterium merdipullorum]|nr:glutamate--tRNA ligase [Candidatus Ruthenibacterium merdipullorum]
MEFKRVRTRFAPSPTGYMHVGNLRTALYTYLTAKHEDGIFILRIEDTDQGRYVEGAVDVIYNTLRETGLVWDEGPDVGGPVGPYVQSQRMGMFREYAEQLVKLGKAYYCFCTEERLQTLHESQKAAGEAVGHYDGHCRELPPEEVQRLLAAGTPYVIRQKMPRTGKTAFDDLVYGHIEVENAELEDQILLKSDGMPTYNFANVVDDHLMHITHVIRGSEYLSSAPKYNLLYEAFGWQVPTYIHCPPVMKDAHTKLSKRNGDASYQDLVAKGYLSEAILNYLLLLGWSPKGEEEIFSLEEMVKIWNPANINKSPAIFDTQKLTAINAAYIRALPAEKFAQLAAPWLDKVVQSKVDRTLLCANLQPRCEFLADIPPRVAFIDTLPDYELELFENKKQKTTPDTAREALTAILAVLEPLQAWNKDAIFEACRAKAEAMEKKNGWLMYPLGIALAGQRSTPGGGTDLAAMLGKEKTLQRIRLALEKLG